MTDRLCLGLIKSVEPYHLNVSLLHGAKGRVKITDINLPYREALEQLLEGNKNENVKMLSEMFNIGQIVRCSTQPGGNITDVSKVSKAMIDLSLNPSRVNRNLVKSLLKPYVTFVGAIKSVEDNGYLVDSGIPRLDLFLPFEETSLSANGRYSIGCLVELAIIDDKISKGKSRVLRVSMLKRSSVPDSDDISFDCLLPGMQIPVKVITSGLEGLDCSFRSFSVHIPAQHCPQEVKKYSSGSKLNACIVDIDLESKVITASILPHFVKDNLNEYDNESFKQVKVGTIIENAVLNRRERNCVYLMLPQLKRCGLLLKANAYSKDVPKKWTSQFPEKTPIKCRIIDFDLFLNIPLISIKKSALESQFLTIEDVKVGAKISVTVKKFVRHGVSVKISSNISGVIPYMHLSDIPIKNPQERFKIKSKIQAMVLDVDFAKGEIHLTAKKSLISSNFPILGSANMLQSWEDIEAKNKVNKYSPPEPFIVSAFVIQSNEKGMLVCGVNNVRGWIPRSQIVGNEQQAENLTVSKGETLQLRVLKRLQVSQNRASKPSTQFLLSQILDPENARPLPKAATNKVQVGELYFCRIAEVKPMGLEVSLLKTPESKDVISTAFLPYTHLSDSISICNLAQHSRDTCFKASSIFSLTEEGKTPTNVVVVNTASKAGILVSVKPSLLEAARAADNSSKAGFVRSTEHFQVGTQWVGWIAFHRAYGMFVEFPGGVRGLVPNHYVCDRKAPEGTDWNAILPVGTSVEAKVVEVNGTRLLLSLRMGDTYTSAEEQYVKGSIVRAEQYLKECKWLCKHVKHLKNLSHFTMGQVVKFHVDGLTEEVVTGWVALPSSSSKPETIRVPAAALLLNTDGVECPLGSVHEAVVTLPNPDAGKLEVALLPALLKSVKQRREGHFDDSTMQVRHGQVISSYVVSMGNTKDIIVVALKQHALGHLAVVPARRSLNDIIGGNAWALGQLNRITIRSDLPSESEREKIFAGNLSIYDPIVPKTKKSKENILSPEAIESLTTPGTHLSEVVFIGLKGRANALFRLPNTRGVRSLNTRLICRLVDLKPSSAKDIRKFLADVPDVGTTFKDAVVIKAPTPTLTVGARLPLSSRIARISFNQKEPQVGDLVSAMFLGVHGACWRLLLPNNAQGLLHVSCMSKSSRTENDGDEQVSSTDFPKHPAKSIWLTCRIIDQVENLKQHEGEEDLDKSMEVIEEKNKSEKSIPQIALGDDMVPVGNDDEEEEAPRLPTKIFYVSTDASDIRKWNPEKYNKELELTLNEPIVGIIKHRFRNNLIVNLNYKTDVVVPYFTPLRPNDKVGAPIKIVLTSLEPLEGRLAESLVRRKRSISATIATSEMDSEAPSLKKRKRNISVHLPEKKTLLNITDMFARYADFLPAEKDSNKDERKEQVKEVEEFQQEESENQDIEMADATPKDEKQSLSTVKNEARLAEIAKATSAMGSDLNAKIPHMTTVEEFEVAVRNAPQNARIWSLYAGHYQAAGDLNRARTVLKRGLSSPAAFNLGSDDFVSNLLLDSLRLESVASISSGEPSANEAGKKNLEEVISRIEQIDKADLTTKAVNLLSNMGLHENADSVAKKFVKGHPLVPQAWLNLVRARLRAGNFAGAREAQRNAGQTLNISQIQPFALGCAKLEMELGDYERALKLMEEQIAVHPQRKALYVNCIRMLLQAAKRKDAEIFRQKALSKLPEKEHDLITRMFKA